MGVLGGGPGGLYCALLLRQAVPDAEITVVERNRADDTYGFGVVFSDETLGAFRDADAASYGAIAARFRRWDAIDTFYRGTCTVSRGHGFAALSRRALLAVLQERCGELGVTLRFERDLTSLAELAADGYDLLVAADGVNSLARRELADAVAPRIEHGRTRFCWLGTTRPLDAFTFLFQESPAGLFQVHAYPYDESMATWIVECSDATWRAAGLVDAEEAATVAYCELLFGDFLRGHRLIANRSIWRTFPTVACARWSAEVTAPGATTATPVVLLGDAAHTAHFSIGSGTKLAMEDSIALVAALRDHGSHIPDALAAYEDSRRVDVAKLQKAAKTSREWFEACAAGRYLGQHPLQLTFNMMTRSKRITYDNLAERDPALIAAVNALYARAEGAPVTHTWKPADSLGPATVVWRVEADSTRSDADCEAADAPSSPPPMFVPFRARSLELPNRIVVSPMCQYSAVDGTVDDWHLVHLGSRALGGAGLVIAEMTDVEAEGRITFGCAGMYARDHVAAWRRIVDFVHARSAAKIGLQLAHAGRKGSTHHPWEGDSDHPLTAAEGAWKTIAPSPLPFKPDWPPPREMTAADLDRVREAFARGARWAEEAGFDWLELHMAHGYLLSSFLSPLANVRGDDFGGSLENRMRWPLSVFAAVRDAWPAQRPISVRLTASDWMPDGSGMTPDEAVVVARELRRLGCDLIDVSSGGNSPLSQVEYGRMYQVPFADQIRHEAGVPVMAVGALLGADHANTVLAAGRADLAVMARPHLADPYLTVH
ncbi:MAG TPA: FAD-dependent monooxygenase, partial [Thermoanaerobaculia bacterium]|nr:FAD-dependent monooxygenase [Thermoanaerobaculia bacterium]